MRRVLFAIVLVAALIGASLPAQAANLTPSAAINPHQDGGSTNTVSFNGIQLQFDSALARSVNITQHPGDPVDAEAFAGPVAPHIQFQFYNEQTDPRSFLEGAGTVRIYEMAALADYPFQPEQVEALQTLLTDRPDLNTHTAITPENVGRASLPFLPMFPAQQALLARAQYIDLAAMSGVGYLTVYRQDFSPFRAGEFLYTFQGISNDGRYYVAMIFRITAPGFPTEIGSDFNPDEFVQAYPTYVMESVATLNEAAPDSFSPSLGTVEAVINSLSLPS